jgi:hypothetical protein
MCEFSDAWADYFRGQLDYEKRNWSPALRQALNSPEDNQRRPIIEAKVPGLMAGTWAHQENSQGAALNMFQDKVQITSSTPIGDRKSFVKFIAHRGLSVERNFVVL